MLKRIFDFFSSFLGVLILSPLLILLALIIKVSSSGPAFFMQSRVGRKGKPFKLIKLRTMSLSKEAAKGSFDAGDISRITPFGRFLRKTKLDELPQLFNVLKGDMSLVGPRPEVEQWTRVYPEKWAIVHSVRPGITDYASIHFRNEEEILAASVNPYETYKNEILPRKLALNIEYVNNQSFLEDLKIVFKTIFTVIVK